MEIFNIRFYTDEMQLFNIRLYPPENKFVSDVPFFTHHLRAKFIPDLPTFA